MKVSSNYKLELRWSGVRYDTDDTAFLSECYFSGPVLKNTAKINSNDQILLDMTYQHKIMIPDFYQATLRWREVEYKGDRVFLKEATIKGKHVNSLEKLRANDWILIDCSKHEERSHPFWLVYWAEVRKADGAEKY